MSSPRKLLLTISLTTVSACTTTAAAQPSTAPMAPTLVVAEPHLRAPEVGLPAHAAAIVDVALLPPQPGEQWRLASGDADGWVRIWADGKLLAVHHAHPHGLTALQLANDGRWYTAGADGRVLEWRADSLAPQRSFAFGRPISALAVADPHLAISDGHYVQLWSRDEQPRLLWTTAAYGFVTGLSMSSTGGVIAAAELRQWALTQGLANHPLAPFEDGPQAPSPEQQAALRAAAERDFPGAAADFLEVWQPSHNRTRQLAPQAPIDADLGVLSRGGVVYREIYAIDTAAVIERRLEDEAHVPATLAKPWAFWNDENGEPTAASRATPVLPVGDFRMTAAEEVVVVDLFPGWGAQPPGRGWRVGDRRELALDAHHAALGDGQGNLAVVAWARPAETGWQAAGEARIDLLAGARGQPRIVTATLEPRTQYRLWSLDRGEQRTVRVEAPWQVLASDDPTSMYPAMLALDSEPNVIVASMTSYAADGQNAVRVVAVADGVAQILSLASAADSLDIGLSPDGAHLLAWAPGALAHSWHATAGTGAWTDGPDAFAGIPRFSANGHWSAHVSAFERHIVDLVARHPVVDLRSEAVDEELGEGSLVAIADDGTLAWVQPFGGGTLSLLGVDGKPRTVELPGAATALTWVTSGDGAQVVLIGFADGTIARLDGEDVVPTHAGAGGRIWELTGLGGRAGVYVELDERGLMLHRLADEATLELYLADTTSLSLWDGMQPQPLSSAGVIAIWRSGSATPPCRILDGTGLGVIASESIERWPLERSAELFEQFLAGAVCTTTPAADDEAAPAEAAPAEAAPAEAAPAEAAPAEPAPE